MTFALLDFHVIAEPLTEPLAGSVMLEYTSVLPLLMVSALASALAASDFVES